MIESTTSVQRSVKGSFAGIHTGATELNIIITGASRGIGRAVSLAFAREHHHLLLTGFSSPDALYTVKKEAEAFGSTVDLFLGDLGTEEGCRTLKDRAEECFSHTDLLVNNAGIADVRLFQDSDDSNLQKILNTDLLSVIRITKGLLPSMIGRHCGRIINISSVWGLSGASCEVEYSAAKGAVNTFTKALAKECAPSGISVNAIAFGAVDTEMNGHLSPEEKKDLEEEIPFGRMATAEEAAEMVLLLSKAPLYLTGEIIRFDGGWL